MANRVDAFVAVLKLKLLLLIGKQARLDPWILDEIAPFDDASEPCLKQRLADPVSSSHVQGKIRIQFKPVVQCCGNDSSVPVRAYTNVDPGAPIPDGHPRLVDGCGIRPIDECVGQLVANMFKEPESSMLVPLIATPVECSRSRNLKPGFTVKEERKPY